jgi:hypothetical protein
MKPIRFLLLGAAALSMAVVLTAATWTPIRTRSLTTRSAQAKPATVPVRTIHTEVAPASAAQVVRELDRADAESRQALEVQLRSLDAFFDKAQQGVPRFVDHVLGLNSQWALIRDWLPWGQGGHHARLLRRAFHAEVLDPAGLDQAVQQVVARTQAALDEIDDALLVRLRCDLDNLPATKAIIRIEQDRWRVATRSAREAAVTQSRPAVTPALAAELVALAGSELVTRAVLRRGVVSGTFALAASVPVSLGVGLVAALAVDQIVSWALDSWADPRGNLIRQLQAQLTELRQVVVVGSTQAPGLRPRLERMLRERAAARRKVILESQRETRP